MALNDAGGGPPVVDVVPVERRVCCNHEYEIVILLTVTKAHFCASLKLKLDLNRGLLQKTELCTWLSMASFESERSRWLVVIV